MNHFSFRARMRSVLSLLAAVVIVAVLAVAVAWRPASSASAPCGDTNLELVGQQGTSSSAPEINLRGDYAAAEASILGLPPDYPRVSVLVPLAFH